MVDRLDRAMHNFVWTGAFVYESPHGHRALLSKYHSQLRQDEGGVGKPNIRMELRALAAATLVNSANGRTLQAQGLGDVLSWAVRRGGRLRTT